MNYKWESEKARLKAYIKIPAAKKLEWLEQMRQLVLCLPKKTLVIRKKMRLS